MSKSTKIDITPEQLAEIVRAQLLALLPQADAPSTGVRRNKAGRLVDANGRFVKEGEAKTPEKAKTEAKEGVALRKATRKAFIKAVKKEFGVDLTGKSTKEVAKHAIDEGHIPTGFVVGEGYRELVS